LKELSLNNKHCYKPATDFLSSPPCYQLKINSAMLRIFKALPIKRNSSYVLARVVDGELQEARIDLEKTSSTKDRVVNYGIEGSIWAEASVNNMEVFAQVGEIFSREATGRFGKLDF
jgi:hypothetical protein